MEDRFKRILLAAEIFPMPGGTGVFFHHNGSSTVDSRYVRAYPPLHALYLIPGYLFDSVGTSQSPLSWHWGTQAVKDAPTRKLLNIAGIDAYLFKKSDYLALASSKKAGLTITKDSPDDRMGLPFVLVEDERSYAMAYLANHIRYVSPVLNRFSNYRAPLSGAHPQMDAYKTDTAHFWKLLTALPEEPSAYVESTDHPHGAEERMLGTASLDITNIAGNRALFRVNCDSPDCLLVFNQASLSGWSAFIDKTAASILRANFGFLSVKVPRGEHMVWFEHLRIGVIWGALVTLVSYLIGVVNLVWQKQKSLPASRAPY
jgi:hypothetical protein